MGIFDFFKKEKKLQWPKNEIIKEFDEHLPDAVVRTRKIASQLYNHAKKVNINNSAKYYSGKYLNPPQKNVIVVYNYFDNGEVKSINCFKLKNKDPDGLHGYSIYFYEDSQIKTCSYFVESRIDGMHTSYYSNGFIKNILNFDNNFLDGLNYTYHENEKLSSVVNYQKGSQNGEVYAYHENGNLFFDGQTKNGDLDGIWNIYDDEGNSAGKIIYKMGLVIEGDSDLNDLIKTIMIYEWGKRALESGIEDFMNDGD